MIRSLSAFTREIDDAAIAVREICGALDLENNLLTHSLGLIACYSEFEETGVLKAICQALPFDCIGATTCLSAAGREVDQLMLSIVVLTSDDCAFQTTAIPLAEDHEGAVALRMEALLHKSQERPALLIGYFPLMNTVSGDMILAAIDRASGGIPLFGTLAVDHTADNATVKTFHNGEAFREAAVLGAVYGAPKVTFQIASIDETRARKPKAIITGSKGNILTGVNGKTALEYLEEIGLEKADIASGLGIIPLIVDDMDGGTHPVVRSVFTLTPEGYAVCGGEMPLNATLSLGRIDREDVLQTTATALTSLLDDDSVILCYSCIARYFILGAYPTAEAEKVRGITGGERYLFASSGGEICPLPDGNGKLKNYFHNYTSVFCRLS